MGNEKTMLELDDALMVIDTKTQRFDMQAIKNRYFMFNPQTGTLLLWQQCGQREQYYSDESRLEKGGITEPVGQFVSGWVGTHAQEYKNGVIHFAPDIKPRYRKLFRKGMSALRMFQKNGARENTVVRGFGQMWEQPLSKVLEAPARENGKRPSVVGQLKPERPQQKAQPPKASQHEPER